MKSDLAKSSRFGFLAFSINPVNTLDPDLYPRRKVLVGMGHPDQHILLSSPFFVSPPFREKSIDILYDVFYDANVRFFTTFVEGIWHVMH